MVFRSEKVEIRLIDEEIEQGYIWQDQDFPDDQGLDETPTCPLINPKWLNENAPTRKEAKKLLQLTNIKVSIAKKMHFAIFREEAELNGIHSIYPQKDLFAMHLQKKSAEAHLAASSWKSYLEARSEEARWLRLYLVKFELYEDSPETEMGEIVDNLENQCPTGIVDDAREQNNEIVENLGYNRQSEIDEISETEYHRTMYFKEKEESTAMVLCYITLSILLLFFSLILQAYL